MSSSRGKQYVTVEVKPSASSSSNIAPSSPIPSSPSSPKAVRFAPTLENASRELTPTEAWSMYHFETHARQCPDCYDPMGVHLKGGQLCHTGHGLAQDVAIHVYHYAGEIYSQRMDDHKHVRVELPPAYTQVRDLLRSMERALKSTSRTVPIVSYDPVYPVSARRSRPEKERKYSDERTEVIIEPANTERDKRPRRTKSKKSSGYRTVAVENNVDPEPSSSRTQPRPLNPRRGSLYETEIQRQRKDKGYLVEVREPARERERERKYDVDEEERRRRRDRRKSGGFFY